MLRLCIGALACSWAILSGSLARADTADCGASEAAIRATVETATARKWELSTKISNGPLRLALSVEVIRQDFPDSHTDDWNVGWIMVGDDDRPVPVEPPSKEVAQAFIDEARVSATTCPNVLAYARRSGISVPRRGESRPLRKSNGLYDRTFLELTKAITSADGAEALVYVSSVSGPLAGGGRLMLFRRQNGGEWVLSGQLPLWVS